MTEWITKKDSDNKGTLRYSVEKLSSSDSTDLVNRIYEQDVLKELGLVNPDGSVMRSQRLTLTRDGEILAYFDTVEFRNTRMDIIFNKDDEFVNDIARFNVRLMAETSDTDKTYKALSDKEIVCHVNHNGDNTETLTTNSNGYINYKYTFPETGSYKIWFDYQGDYVYDDYFCVPFEYTISKRSTSLAVKDTHGDNRFLSFTLILANNSHSDKDSNKGEYVDNAVIDCYVKKSTESTYTKQDTIRTNSGGVAYFKYTPTEMGLYNVYFKYNGDDEYNGVTSSLFNVKLEKYGTYFDIENEGYTLEVDDSLSITSVLRNMETQTQLDGKQYTYTFQDKTTTLTNGKFEFTPDTGTIGTYPIIYEYVGDSLYYPCTKTVTLIINPHTCKLELTDKSVTPYLVGQPIQVYCELIWIRENKNITGTEQIIAEITYMNKTTTTETIQLKNSTDGKGVVYEYTPTRSGVYDLSFTHKSNAKYDLCTNRLPTISVNQIKASIELTLFGNYTDYTFGELEPYMIRLVQENGKVVNGAELYLVISLNGRDGEATRKTITTTELDITSQYGYKDNINCNSYGVYHITVNTVNATAEQYDTTGVIGRLYVHRHGSYSNTFSPSINWSIPVSLDYWSAPNTIPVLGSIDEVGCILIQGSGGSNWTKLNVNCNGKHYDWSLSFDFWTDFLDDYVEIALSSDSNVDNINTTYKLQYQHDRSRWIESSEDGTKVNNLIDTGRLPNKVWNNVKITCNSNTGSYTVQHTLGDGTIISKTISGCNTKRILYPMFRNGKSSDGRVAVKNIVYQATMNDDALSLWYAHEGKPRGFGDITANELLGEKNRTYHALLLNTNKNSAPNNVHYSGQPLHCNNNWTLTFKVYANDLDNYGFSIVDETLEESTGITFNGDTMQLKEVLDDGTVNSKSCGTFTMGVWTPVTVTCTSGVLTVEYPCISNNIISLVGQRNYSNKILFLNVWAFGGQTVGISQVKYTQN